MIKEWEGVDSGYIEAVNGFLKSNENINIPNPGINYAKFTIYNLISSAKSTIIIFAANLSKGIYDDERILESVRNSPVENVEVLVEGKISSEKFSNLDNVNVREIKISRGVQDRMPGHFIVVDSRRFRFEQYIDKSDLRDNSKGIVNFNDLKVSKGMENAFSQLKSIMEVLK